LAGLQQSRRDVFQAEKRLPGVAVIAHKPWKGIPNDIVYQKGGWTLHMLRGQLGDAEFWAGIREYYRRYRDGNASTQDFRQVMEEMSGSGLDWFFQQWLHRAGSPALEGGWKYRAASKTIAIDLAQSQAGEAFRLPLEVAVTAPRAETQIEKIAMTAKRQKFEIAAEREPTSVELDPNTWILADIKFARQ